MSPKREPTRFLTETHEGVSRDYLSRAQRPDRAECMRIASQFGRDYWDGERHYGYGGYSDDGRWAPVAKVFLDHYRVPKTGSVLDIGCGKGFWLREFKRASPSLTVKGLDISKYAIENSPPDIRDTIVEGSAETLPFQDGEFDLVVSNMTLHNLELPKLMQALREIERVSRGKSWIRVESWRTEQEKANLLNWQLTCRAFFSPAEWLWIFDQTGYTGDFEFGYFT